MTTLDKLKEEAVELGISFSPNIGEETLKERVAKALDAKQPATKNQEQKSSGKGTKLQELVKRTKEKAFKKSYVKITNLDKRENESVTTAYLGFENMFFDLSRIVPLDTVIELEAALIEVAKKATMTIHVNDPKTGNKMPKDVNKYAVNMEEAPEE